MTEEPRLDDPADDADAADSTKQTAFETMLFTAMVVAVDLLAVEALALGEPVPTSAIRTEWIEWLGLNGAEFILDEATCRRIELLRRDKLVRPTIEERVEKGDFLANTEAADATKLRFLPGREFRKQELAKIEPLLGEGNDALMMPGSLLLLAGIGGAGKTTLATHAIAHWSAGLPWFGIQVGRPLKVVVIENEGPHDPYARKVDEFAERFVGCCCSGEPHGTADGIDKNTFFLDAPWGKFSFDDKGLADELNGFVRETEADLVVANPLGRLGMKGAGTPEETREFLQLLANAGLNEDFAALLLHHLAKVNKAVPLVQQVSGDWGPHPDTIMVLEQAGERMSKLSFGKVRWGDQGRQPLLLRWLTDPSGPVGYHADSGVKVITDRELYERIDSFIREAGKPVGITAITRGVTGQTERIRVLVGEGCDAGRYRRHGGDKRPVYTIGETVGDEGEQETMEV